MAALLYKDLIITWKTCKFVLLAAVIFAFIAGMKEQQLLFTVYAPIVLTATTITTLAYDERCGWLRYADGLPYSRNTIVTSKYVMAFLCCMAAMLVTAVAGVLSVRIYAPAADPVLNDAVYQRTVNLSEVALTALVQLLAGTLQTVIMLPVALRFGVEKGRIIYIVCIVVFCALGLYLPQPGIVVGTGTLLTMGLTIVALCLVLWVVSYLIGTALYRKREL